MVVRGVVQGVGFRPFVYRLARDLSLNGWVNNTAMGVFVEVEGDRERLDTFLCRLEADRPPASVIQSIEPTYLDPVGYTDFQIVHSDESGEKTTLILPDLATCADCLADIADPTNRRYRYPFTNCTNCGPRFTIIEGLPYDRPNTTMRRFSLCPACREEYENPDDRRFHAQPNACPVCGPHLELWDTTGKPIATHDDALRAAADALREGKIVAVKGVGGFHLMVDARNEAAVQLLRARKHREEKPFAVMYPTLEMLRSHCAVSEAEARLLLSPQSPIVLLQRLPGSTTTGSPSLPRGGSQGEGTASGTPPLPQRRERGPGGEGLESIAASVAPNNPNLGVMLPYAPLHHLLLADLGFPVVATSGNLSDEPICTDEHEAVHRLGGIADLFLVHNRPIARQVDDSVVRVLLDRELVLRRARGYAPLPITLRDELPPILGVGAHQKSAVALAVGRQVFISQHIGDLETEPAFAAVRKIAQELPALYERQPEIVACDLHPDYLSTQYAETSGRHVRRVQHHFAHVLACMAENDLEIGPALGISWDGTGYGTDGTICGGEFLRVTEDGGFERTAHLRTFRLPGGAKAVREPRRCAAGVLYEIYGDALFDHDGGVDGPLSTFPAYEREVLRTILERRLNAPVTSSAGRLFDAFAGLIGLRQIARFEGQAAMELEFALSRSPTDDAYPLRLLEGDDGACIVDWEPMIRQAADDLASGMPYSGLSERFHNGLVEAMVAVAQRVGEERVVLSGGCFQNAYLTERAVRRLRAEGFRPYWHQRVPPNDGGIALGQIMSAAAALAASNSER